MKNIGESDRVDAVVRISDKNEWDRAVNLGGGYPLQLWGWGEVKASSGHWKPVRDLVTGPDGVLLGGAQVLLRRLPGPMGPLGYVPRGPFCASALPTQVLNKW